ncbi:MAG: hypothetical protein Q8K67_01920 [Geothrix sp.]|nr:hypothetical protein [Geothrix sp.]
MLTEAFTLLIQLPPLAFGPALPSGAFLVPRALVCEIRELGRIQEPSRAPWPAAVATSLDPRSLRPARAPHLVNPVVDGLLLMAAAYGTHATWDDRTWSTRAWQAAGAMTPVLFPPQVPPMWALGR